MKSLIHRIAQLFLRAKTWKPAGDGTKVGIFIPLPTEIAEQFPSLEGEDSPPHVTVLLVGDVPKDQESFFLAIVESVSFDLPPVIKAQLHQVDYFRAPQTDTTVAHMSVKFSADLARYKYRLISALQESGFELSDNFQTSFFPHVTLSYLEGLDVVWDGEVPEGIWSFNQVHIWGLSQPYEIKFRSQRYSVLKP